MKNHFFPVVRLIILPICCWLVSIHTVQAQSCPPVTNVTATVTTSHTFLTWTKPRGTSSIEVTYVTNNVKRTYTSFSTSIAIPNDPNAVYQYFQLKAQYGNGCVSAAAVWSPDIIMTIDDIYGFIGGYCGSTLGNPFILVDNYGVLFPIQLNNLCCLHFLITGGVNELAYQSLFISQLFFYIDEGTIFNSNFCENIAGLPNPPGPSLGGGGTNKREPKIEEANDCHIFPNPCQHLLHINLDLGTSQTGHLTLCNALGQTMETWMNEKKLGEGIHQNHYSVAHLQAGIYFVVYRTKDVILRKKLVIQH